MKVLADIQQLENRLANWGDFDSREAVKSIVMRYFSHTKEGLDLLSEYGPKACTEVADETASFYNNMEEIGSSDRWAIIQFAKKSLAGYKKK